MDWMFSVNNNENDSFFKRFSVIFRRITFGMRLSASGFSFCPFGMKSNFYATRHHTRLSNVKEDLLKCLCNAIANDKIKLYKVHGPFKSIEAEHFTLLNTFKFWMSAIFRFANIVAGKRAKVEQGALDL